jgi:hypothetical protein
MSTEPVSVRGLIIHPQDVLSTLHDCVLITVDRPVKMHPEFFEAHNTVVTLAQDGAYEAICGPSSPLNEWQGRSAYLACKAVLKRMSRKTRTT